VLDTFIGKDDRRSDTRVFAEDTLPRLGGVTALDDANLYRMVEGWATGSKIAVLTTNPNAQSQLYLINERLGHWDEHGVWWSNSSYKRITYTYDYKSSTKSVVDTTAYSSADYDQEQAYYAELLEKDNLDGYLVIDQCPMCQALVDVDISAEYCQYCEACMSCWANYVDCMCYTPKSAKSSHNEFDFDNQWVRVYNKYQETLI
jgi:hypothetical protein